MGTMGRRLPRLKSSANVLGTLSSVHGVARLTSIGDAGPQQHSDGLASPSDSGWGAGSGPKHRTKPGPSCTCRTSGACCSLAIKHLFGLLARYT